MENMGEFQTITSHLCENKEGTKFDEHICAIYTL